jgi:hypothetical protein
LGFEDDDMCGGLTAAFPAAADVFDEPALGGGEAELENDCSAFRYISATRLDRRRTGAETFLAGTLAGEAFAVDFGLTSSSLLSIVITPVLAVLRAGGVGLGACPVS